MSVNLIGHFTPNRGMDVFFIRFHRSSLVLNRLLVTVRISGLEIKIKYIHTYIHDGVRKKNGEFGQICIFVDIEGEDST